MPGVTGANTYHPVRTSGRRSGARSFGRARVPFHFLQSGGDRGAIIRVASPLEPVIKVSFFSVTVSNRGNSRRSRSSSHVVRKGVHNRHGTCARMYNRRR